MRPIEASSAVACIMAGPRCTRFPSIDGEPEREGRREREREREREGRSERNERQDTVEKSR